MTHAYLYARFSSAQQSEGHSLERQMQMAQVYCERNGLELSDKTFADLGISGWKEKDRDGLENLLEAVESGRIQKGSHIIVEATDRLSRRGWEAVTDYVRRLVSTGCVFTTLENGQQFTKDNISDLFQVLPLMISAQLAKQESDRKSERVAAAKKKVRDNGILEGNIPFWLTIENGKVIFNDGKRLARRIVDLRLNGMSPYSIARLFNTERLAAPKSDSWNTAVIRQIVRNTLLYGTKTYKPKSGEFQQAAGVAPAICTFEEFQQIQPVNGHKHVPELGPYSTLLRCADCGAPLVVKKKRDGDIYRMCSGKLRKTCDAQGMFKNMDLIMDGELRRLGIIKPNGTDSRLASIDDRLAVLANESASLESLKDRARANPDVYMALLTDLMKVNNEIAELTESKTKILAESKDADFIRVTEIEDAKHKNRLMRTLVERIDCKKTGPKSGTVRVHLKNGFKISFAVQWVKDGYVAYLKADGEKLRDEINRLSQDTDHTFDIDD